MTLLAFAILLVFALFPEQSVFPPFARFPRAPKITAEVTAASPNRWAACAW